MNILNQSQIKSIVKIGVEAGEIAMSYFGGNNLNISKKSDDSPLTIADSLISQLIFAGLQNIAPKIPVTCEEGKNRGFGDGTFWLIDPIDGTSSFAKNDPEFTVNIALVKNKKPIFGLIFAPAIKGSPFYYTNENGDLVKYDIVSDIGDACLRPPQASKHNFIIISSKRSSDQDIFDYIKSQPNLIESGKEVAIQKTSSSFKFIHLIEGKADLYLHLRKSMEWDIAAGQALLQAIGGKITNLDGSEFIYEKAGLVNQPFFAVL